MAFFLAAEVSLADTLDAADTIIGAIGDVEGGVADVEGGVADVEGVIADIEGGVADVEGGLSDVEGLVNIIETMLGYILIITIILTLMVTIAEIFTNLRTGINNHVKCASSEFNGGFDDSLFITGVLAECTWDKFIKFWNGDCTRYYITDIIFGLLYGIIIELPIVLISAIFGIDLQPIVDFVYEAVIVPINDLVYAISGFYVIKWSDNITKKCFRCKGTYDVGGQSITLDKPMNEWVRLYKCSGNQMVQGISRFFGTVIPSDRWSSWWNGDNLPGGDWEPAF
jgi:hypothetical protein